MSEVGKQDLPFTGVHEVEFKLLDARFEGDPPKTKVKYRVQRYKKGWENLPELKTWLRRGSKSTTAECMICEKYIRAHLHTIQTHGRSKKHQELTKVFIEKQSKKSKIHKNDAIDPLSVSPLLGKMATAMLRLARFFAERKVKFLLIVDLIPLLQEIFADPEVLKNLSVSSSKLNVAPKIGELYDIIKIE